MIQNIRQSVHTYVDELDDDFLRAVHAMLETYTQDKAPEYVGEPLTPEELSKQCIEAVEDVQNGNFYTVEEARKIFKPTRETVTLEQLKKEQNFTGIDRAEFDALAKELDIQESYETLIEQV